MHWQENANVRPKKSVCFPFADRPYFFSTDPIFFSPFCRKIGKNLPLNGFSQETYGENKIPTQFR